MREYEDKTKPLLDVFEKKGVLVNYETKKGVKDYPELKQIILDRFSKYNWSFERLLFVLI